MKKILSRIFELKKQHKKMLIAIDGYGGAGKSTLARSLAVELVGAKHIEFDWFYFPHDQIIEYKRFDITRFKTEIVEPFLKGVININYKRYNWGYLAGKPERLEDEILDLQGVSVLIVEGCMTLQEEVADLFQLKIWIGADPLESRKRGIRRDIEEYGLDEDKVHKVWKEWGIWEDRCLEVDDRRQRAEIVL